MLTGTDNLVAAAGTIIKMGPKFVVVKKGEHGTLLMTADNQCFVLPAYPTAEVKDPTGAGDTFAGGMMGYLAAQSKTDWPTLKAAIAHGTAAASLAIEDFSLAAWHSATADDINSRVNKLKNMTQF